VFEVLPDVLPGLLNSSELLSNLTSMFDTTLLGKMAGPDVMRIVEEMINNITQRPDELMAILEHNIPALMKQSGLEDWLRDTVKLTVFPYEEMFAAFKQAEPSYQM